MRRRATTIPGRLPGIDTITVSDDAFKVVDDPEIDIIVELIGGYEPARELVLKAIANGKHVVTANKALIATHGNEIFAAAQKKGVMVAFEAAVAGGIPIIKAVREGLTANRINWIAGIINGTGNFILTEMRDKGRDFADVLAEAQQLGYAEADPTFDVEGIDAAHKLAYWLRWLSAFRYSLIAYIPKVSAILRAMMSAMRSNSVTASSTSALPGERNTVSSYAYTRR